MVAPNVDDSNNWVPFQLNNEQSVLLDELDGDAQALFKELWWSCLRRKTASDLIGYRERIEGMGIDYEDWTEFKELGWAQIEAVGADNPYTDSLIFRRRGDGDPEPFEWLWKGFIPYGRVTIIEGHMKVGKTTVALDILARATRGWPMPGETETREPVNVLILAAEDPNEIDRVFQAAGGDKEYAPIVERKDHGSLLDCSERGLRNIQLAIDGAQASVLYVDAFIDLFPEDSTKDGASRGLMRELVAIAENTGCAIVLCRHWTKSSPGSSKTAKGQGALVLGAKARSILAVGELPGPGGTMKRVICVSASNYHNPDDPNGFEIELKGKEIPGGSRPALTVNFGDRIQVNVSDLDPVQGPTTNRQQHEPRQLKSDGARNFILTHLSQTGGKVASTDLMKLGMAAEFGKTTLENARKALKDDGHISYEVDPITRAYMVVLANPVHLNSVEPTEGVA